ncbi:MAG: MotA/TolQ/ExbB proton channel family protein [Planctomycetes bacterium]|nr:MotA/TolQ/ExbB proton channel family protein [Planctomycetota bacterium]
MKTRTSALTQLGGRVLLLALVFAGWALLRPVAAQDETGNVDAKSVLDDGPDEPARATSGEAADKQPGKKRRGIPTRLSEIFIAGGPMMWPLAACSVVVLMFTIERLVVLRRRRVIPHDFVTRFLEHVQSGQIDRSGALALCEQNASPIAEVFAHGVRKWGKPSVEVEQAIIDGGERQISILRRNLRALNTVATVGPLMGLLGTVYGMIKCFNEFTRTTTAADKLDNLSIGIGEALIATAGGLCVAIPALVLYMYLAGRVDGLVIEMDVLAQKLVNLISAENLSPPTDELPRISQRPKTLGTGALKNS